MLFQSLILTLLVKCNKVMSFWRSELTLGVHPPKMIAGGDSMYPSPTQPARKGNLKGPCTMTTTHAITRHNLTLPPITRTQLGTVNLADLLAMRSVFTYACPDWPLDSERLILSALLAVEDAIDLQGYIPASLPANGEPSADDVTRTRRVLAMLALQDMS